MCFKLKLNVYFKTKWIIYQDELINDINSFGIQISLTRIEHVLFL